MPMYGVPVEDENGAIRVYGEEILCPNVDEGEEDAARRCVGKLRDEFSFDVRDFNLEDKKCFQDLNSRLAIENEVIKKKYKRLKRDYKLLWGYYSNLLIEKECFVTERGDLKKMIAACGHLLDRPNAVAPEQNGGGDLSEDDHVAPPGYGHFCS